MTIQTGIALATILAISAVLLETATIFSGGPLF